MVYEQMNSHNFTMNQIQPVSFAKDGVLSRSLIGYKTSNTHIFEDSITSLKATENSDILAVSTLKNINFIDCSTTDLIGSLNLESTPISGFCLTDTVSRVVLAEAVPPRIIIC